MDLTRLWEIVPLRALPTRVQVQITIELLLLRNPLGGRQIYYNVLTPKTDKKGETRTLRHWAISSNIARRLLNLPSSSVSCVCTRFGSIIPQRIRAENQPNDNVEAPTKVSGGSNKHSGY